MANRSKAILILILRLFVGGIFVFAGTAKLIDPGTFVEQMANYRILSDDWLPALVWFLPSLEIVLGCCLLANQCLFEASTLITSLLGIFTLSLISAWLRGLNIECGCFGSLVQSGAYPFWIARNLLLIAGSCYLCVSACDQPTSGMEPNKSARPSTADPGRSLKS